MPTSSQLISEFIQISEPEDSLELSRAWFSLEDIDNNNRAEYKSSV